jgi:hypothetical protein
MSRRSRAPGCSVLDRLERHFNLDWRWRLGRRLAQDRPGRVRCTDAWLRLAVRLARWRAGGPARELEAAQQALQIHEQNSWPRWLTEAGLLAEEPSGRTAERAGVSAEVVDAYEALFFEVRSRVSARDHLALRALPRRAALGVDRSDTAGLLRLAAWKAGAVGLDEVARVLQDGGRIPKVETAEDLAAACSTLSCRLWLLVQCLPASQSQLRRLLAYQQLIHALCNLTRDIDELAADELELSGLSERVLAMAREIDRVWEFGRAA